MSRTTSLALSMVFSLLTLAVYSPAEAVKLRRPYAENLAFTYGFDNNYGASGCKDYNCGSICYDGHTGTDHPTPRGTNVLAGEDGTVVATFNGCANTGYIHNPCGGRCGNYVKLRHADGQHTIYCHMQRDSLTVSNGARVQCGQKLGKSASSGSSTGPHLHVGWQSSAGTRDLFRGSCTSSPGAWREQRGYRQAVGTSCGCVPSAEVCDGKDNNCNGKIDDGEVCELDMLHQTPVAYASSRTTDINGDGLQDACGRFPEGWGCVLATGDGWGERIQTDLMPDSSGWGHPRYYATIRTGDVDGDGLADVCARHSGGYRCWRSTGDGFEHYADIADYTNAAGWDKPEYYTTFRLADINGDGQDDVCARGPEGWRCNPSTGTGFGATVTGPAWKDDSGYAHPRYYGTIRTGNLNDDGKDDVCIRRAAGFDCYRSTGDGFERYGLLEDFSNEGGWDDMKYWSTIRLVDYDGDGLDDVCGRFYSGIRCVRNNGSGFDTTLAAIADLGVTSGWDDPTNYATFRTGDVTGNGAQEFCARANAGMRCYGVKDGSGFSLSGPEWSDASGWDKPQYYQTLTVTDIDSDRRRDLCGRASNGLHCVRRTDDGFTAIGRLAAFNNADGWDKEKHYSTIRLGAGECKPELCNGFDDNCDGNIDEGSPTQMGAVPPAMAAEFVEAILPAEAHPGEVVDAKVRFKNVGQNTWGVGQLSLHAVAGDPAHIAALRPTTGWPDEAIAALLEAPVAPGEVATFGFSVLVPADAARFDDVRFALNADDTPIACPSPVASVRLGVTTVEDNQNNSPGGDAGNDPNQPDAGSNSSDAGDSDIGGPDASRNSNMGPAATSSCACSSADNAPSPLSTAFWPGLLLLTFAWRRRRKSLGHLANTATLSVLALLVIALVGGTGCDGAEISAQNEAAQTPSVNHEQALEKPTAPDESTLERVGGPPRLLATYGAWRLYGHALVALPQSDQPPRLISELSRDQKPVAWPLADRPISHATFVPGAGDAAPTVAVRTPTGRLLLVDLGADDAAKNTVTEVDQNVGFTLATAANGCCVAYMQGDLGFQTTLRILDLRDQEIQSIELEENAWSPAVSPDASQVIYVAPSSTGAAAIYLRDLDAPDAGSKVLVAEADVFPSGAQPPFWTEKGIFFAGEEGAYRLDLNGGVTPISPDADGLFVDLRSGRVLDGAGREFQSNGDK